MTAHELRTTAPPERVYIIGTDEAGYGPNLGPLLVGASCWSEPTGSLGVTLRDEFGTQLAAPPVAPPSSESVKPRAKKRRSLPSATLFDLNPESVDETTVLSPNVEKSRATTDSLVERLNVALAPVSSARGAFPLVDSKRLYSGANSLAKLERSFLIATRALGLKVASFQDAIRAISREHTRVAPPWEQNADLTIPIAPPPRVAATSLDAAVASVRELLSRERVELLDLRARRMHALEFNAALDRPMLKSDLIADVTTATLAETLVELSHSRPDSDSERAPLYVIALCDKLGGRDRYRHVLDARFPNAPLATLFESRSVSAYRLLITRARDRAGTLIELARPIALETRFTAKGESNAPTALASIVAKYLRELSMTLFNEFWKRATSGVDLQPTAGYPVDAVRFRNAVDSTRVALNITLAEFWRNK